MASKESEVGSAYLAIIPEVDKAALGSAVSGVKSTLGAAGEKLGGVLSGAGKAAIAAAAAGVTAAAGATAVISKQALEAYSAYEQNVGGIQKLFGNMGKSVEEYAQLTGQSVDEIGDKWQTLEDSQNKVLKNAQSAYKTAGLSANDYMENVTSFSAALITSLGNDTAKAADYADMAMVDMSDNANTFGTAIQDIQNAYQGFAKQNYTMLDNLKLGYGGTKSEMQRLIQDASQLTDVQEKLGVTVDASSLSFDNIVAAIHVMQESMQVGGTTAREAATTIEGSVNAMKAAWDNWLVGLGDDSADVEALTGQLVESATTAASNVVPRFATIFGTALGQLPSVVSKAAPVIVSAFGQLGTEVTNTLSSALGADNPIAVVVSGIIGSMEGLTQVVQTATSPWEAFRLAAAYAVNELLELLGSLSENAPQLMEGLASGILSGMDDVARIGSTLMGGLGTYLSENGGQLIETGLQMVLQLSEGLRENAGQLVDAGIEMLTGLAEGIAEGLPAVIENLPEIVSNIAGVINDNAPKLLEAGLNILMTLGNGIIQAIPTLVENIPQIIQAFVDVWSAFSWVDLGTQAITALGNGITALGGLIKQAGSGIVENITSAVMNLPSTLASMGETAMLSLSCGIRDTLSYVGSAAGEIVTSAATALAGFPDRLGEIGIQAITGLIKGIKSMAQSVVGAITGVVDSAIQGAKDLLGIHSPSRVFAEIGRYSVLGMEVGLEGEADGLAKSVRKTVGGAVSAATLELPQLAVSSNASLARVATNATPWASTARQTVVNQSFSTKVVRADSDLYAAAPTIYRNAMREARAYA